MHFSALTSDVKTFEFPTVVTDEDRNVNFFNEKFRILVPSVAAGEPLSKYMKVAGIEKLIRESVSPCTAEIDGKSYMCAYCRIENGYETNHSFSVAVPREHSIDYLTVKLAILTKCEQNNLGRAASPKPLSYRELQNRIDGCLEMTRLAYSNSGLNIIDLTAYMTDVFNYYMKLRYGTEKDHVVIDTDINEVSVDNKFCIEIMTLFHLASKTSRNGRILITASDNGRIINMDFIFQTPKRFSSVLFDKDGKTDENRIYKVLGFDGSDLIFVKKLAAENGGDIDLRFNGESVVASLKYAIPRACSLHSPSLYRTFRGTAATIAKILLCQNLYNFYV